MTHTEFASRAREIHAKMRVVRLAFDAAVLAAERPRDTADYSALVITAQFGALLALLDVADVMRTLLSEIGEHWPGPKA